MVARQRGGISRKNGGKWVRRVISWPLGATASGQRRMTFFCHINTFTGMADLGLAYGAVGGRGHSGGQLAAQGRVA